MKIITWNVNGVRAIVKKEFNASVEKMNPDILCLQETKAQEEEVATALEHFKKFNLFSNSAEKKGYSSTSILSNVNPVTN